MYYQPRFHLVSEYGNIFKKLINRENITINDLNKKSVTEKKRERERERERE